MDNPFLSIEKQLLEVKQQNFQILQQLQHLTAKDNQDKYLSIDETRKMWKPAVSRQTIYGWQQKGLLQRHEINGKPYFLKSEILHACQTIQRYKHSISKQ